MWFMIMNLKAGDGRTKQACVCVCARVCVYMCVCVCVVVSVQADLVPLKLSFSSVFSFTLDTSTQACTHTRTHTHPKWMMWSRCYRALCSLLQSVPLPLTKAINRMKLAEQCWAGADTGRAMWMWAKAQIPPFVMVFILCH